MDWYADVEDTTRLFWFCNTSDHGITAAQFFGSFETNYQFLFPLVLADGSCCYQFIQVVISFTLCLGESFSAAFVLLLNGQLLCGWWVCVVCLVVCWLQSFERPEDSFIQFIDGQV